MASARSLYDVLNVAPDAEPVVIEAAYRALMKKYHPDQAGVPDDIAASNAAEINQAFSILRDPKRRSDYDRRDLSRFQAFHLAESQVLPPPRRHSAFGWSGWFVASLLGFILFAIINGRGGLIVPATETDNQAAPLAATEPDFRSQPEKIEPAFRAASRPTDIDREILARESAAAASALRAPDIDPAKVALPQTFGEESRSTFSTPHGPAVHSVRPKSRRRGSVQSAAAEEDFLKREGYIY